MKEEVHNKTMLRRCWQEGYGSQLYIHYLFVVFSPSFLLVSFLPLLVLFLLLLFLLLLYTLLLPPCRDRSIIFLLPFLFLLFLAAAAAAASSSLFSSTPPIPEGWKARDFNWVCSTTRLLSTKLPYSLCSLTHFLSFASVGPIHTHTHAILSRKRKREITFCCHDRRFFFTLHPLIISALCPPPPPSLPPCLTSSFLLYCSRCCFLPQPFSRSFASS